MPQRRYIFLHRLVTIHILWKCSRTISSPNDWCYSPKRILASSTIRRHFSDPSPWYHTPQAGSSTFSGFLWSFYTTYAYKSLLFLFCNACKNIFFILITLVWLSYGSSNDHSYLWEHYLIPYPSILSFSTIMI